MKPFFRFLSPAAALGLGVGLGIAIAIGARELLYVNWQPAAAAVDEWPLLIRKDAKGDGHFGAARSGNRRHRGVDLTAPLDSPVRALRSGIVVQVGNHRGLGHYVELEHKHQLRSLYAHLGAVSVEPGQRVRQGQSLGTVGKTGNARSPWVTPHVHLEVVKNGTPIDPALVGVRAVDGQNSMVSSPDAPDESSDAAGGE